MKSFKYTLYADSTSETDILRQQYELSKKLHGIFTIAAISPIRHLYFGKEGRQMRQDLVIDAPKCFTKEAIYTVMNSIKPQPLEFLKP